MSDFSNIPASPSAHAHSGDQADATEASDSTVDGQPASDQPTPDLDQIAASFDEIEGALRRLDDGTYFESNPANTDPTPGPVGQHPAV